MSRRLWTATALVVVLALPTMTPRLFAGQGAWQPSSGHAQIPIWPDAISNARPVVVGPEEAGTVVDSAGSERLVAGKPWMYVGKVSRPTMTVYSPSGNNTGTPVVVFPGGGYNVLAIDLEGTEVCDYSVRSQQRL